MDETAGLINEAGAKLHPTRSPRRHLFHLAHMAVSFLLMFNAYKYDIILSFFNLGGRALIGSQGCLFLFSLLLDEEGAKTTKDCADGGVERPNTRKSRGLCVS